MDPIAQSVRDYILEEFLPGTPASELKADTPLITGGVLDSLATIKLVSFLEEQYNITIEPHEANVDYLNTVDEIAKLVREKSAKR